MHLNVLKHLHMGLGFKQSNYELTVNLPQITCYIYGVGRNDMILMGANTFWGPLEGVGPKMAASEASAIRAEKRRDFQGPPHFNGPSNGSARIKIIKF